MTEAATKIQSRDTVTRRVVVGFIYLCMIAVVVCLMCTSVSAQSKTKVNDDPALKPRPVSLKTKDGVVLRAFYFPSEKGKKAPTALLVHEWKGQASPYGTLVKALRDSGCAVLVPDYRGHGGSKEYTDVTGAKKKFNLGTMNKRDVENIIGQDLEQAKRFLKEENNEERLNLNALVMIGVREGCVFATHWAQRDWTFAPVGSKKRGQDVKALVLISPKKVHMGVALDKALSPPILTMPTMLIAGRGSAEENEARRLHKRLEVYKQKITRTREAPEGLKLAVTNSSLSGPRLAQSPDVIAGIVKFVKESVPVSDDLNPWVDRSE